MPETDLSDEVAGGDASMGPALAKAVGSNEQGVRGAADATSMPLLCCSATEPRRRLGRVVNLVFSLSRAVEGVTLSLLL